MGTCQVLRNQAHQMGPIPGTQRAGGSLVFNLEVEAGAEVKASTQHAEQPTSQAQAERIQAFVRVSYGFPTQLLHDVRRLRNQILLDDERVDAVLLAAMLSERGYSVLVRCALGGAANTGAPGSCFRNLRHEFVFVRCESGEYEGVELLVDPNFREQFQIPQPTAAFSALLSSVPEIFVGTSVRLHPVVELICGEMAASFEARGLTIPPWRRASAMMTKWIPAKVKDIAVDSPGGASPGGVSPRQASPPTATTATTARFWGPSTDPVLPAPAAVNGGGWRVGVDGPVSPERRLREAAQQLETLALHNQRQASPRHSPTQGHPLLLPPPSLAPPTAQDTRAVVQEHEVYVPVGVVDAPQPEVQAQTPVLGPIAQQARQQQQQWRLWGVPEEGTWGAGAPVPMMIDAFLRQSDTCLPVRTNSGTLPNETMAAALAGDPTANMFVRHSEPSLRRRPVPPVSLLSVQLATARPASPPGMSPSATASSRHLLPATPTGASNRLLLLPATPAGPGSGRGAAVHQTSPPPAGAPAPAAASRRSSIDGASCSTFSPSGVHTVHDPATAAAAWVRGPSFTRRAATPAAEAAAVAAAAPSEGGGMQQQAAPAAAGPSGAAVQVEVLQPWPAGGAVIHKVRLGSGLGSPVTPSSTCHS